MERGTVRIHKLAGLGVGVATKNTSLILQGPALLRDNIQSDSLASWLSLTLWSRPC